MAMRASCAGNATPLSSGAGPRASLVSRLDEAPEVSGGEEETFKAVTHGRQREDRGSMGTARSRAPVRLQALCLCNPTCDRGVASIAAGIVGGRRIDGTQHLQEPTGLLTTFQQQLGIRLVLFVGVAERAFELGRRSARSEAGANGIQRRELGLTGAAQRIAIQSHQGIALARQRPHQL
ncbi:hypothetical protein [uncultured Aquimonas sp.]|uniref:hypothetical protein n=1 Tax=uncultured Aquimonas sp. TaxID=385483 RepID=UPI00262511CB|nr:hypothetical protein [uncultured Aquimonas sp.]